MRARRFACAVLALAWMAALPAGAQSLPGSAPLTETNSLADVYLAGLERWVARQTEAECARRAEAWRRALSDGRDGCAAFLATNRVRLAFLLGVRDERVTFDAPEPVATLSRSAVLGENATHVLMEIRWPVVGGYVAEGLLLEPKAKPVRKNAVWLAHAGVTPEQLLGLSEGGGACPGFAWPEEGCRLVLPAVVSREKTVFESAFKKPGKDQLPGKMRMTNREYVYRPAYVMGRHVIGYEIQTVLALADWFVRECPQAPVEVGGWGDGGLVALYAGALDPRVGKTVVSGYFGDRRELWREPADRNVFGLLRDFGDAEVAALIAPRSLVVLDSDGPRETFTREMGREGGAPGELVPQSREAVAREAAAARRLAALFAPEGWLTLAPAAGAGAPPAPLPVSRVPDARAREQRLICGMNGFSQHLLALSPEARRGFMAGLDFSSPEAFDRSAEPYRDYYRERIMGRIREPKLPLNVRSRRVEETPVFDCHEVALDVLPDFLLTGFLLVPKGLGAGERRPVIVAQHGRGGTPRTLMSVASGGRPTYHEIAPRLAAEGYVVFLPQNPYIFEDRYRQWARKASPLGLSLYSVIYAQYEQMFAWLRTLPQADASKVAFIGQSYGGKTAVRVPPLMREFCLAVSTGDFNDGVTKMASTLHPFSFALWDEYEMFEFDLGNTFNYSDLAGLMAPRPFMVQRGHGDAVAWDEFVGYEYALVRRQYARLKLPERTEIVWFDGGHEIALEPAVAFFNRFLKAR